MPVTVPDRGARIDATDPTLRYFTRHPRGGSLVSCARKGCTFYDSDGRAILDGASGAAVVCLGHGNQRVIQRLTAQAQAVAFAHTSTFITTPVLELAERLRRTPATRTHASTSSPVDPRPPRRR